MFARLLPFLPCLCALAIPASAQTSSATIFGHQLTWGAAALNFAMPTAPGATDSNAVQANAVQSQAPVGPLATANGGMAGGEGVDCRNPQFGAAGDASTDDTAALQSCFKYAVSNHLAVHLATPSRCYKVSAPLDVEGLTLFGDLHGLHANGTGGTLYMPSEICYVNFATANRAVLDATGAGANVDGISVLPLNGTLKGSNIGSCFFSEPSTTAWSPGQTSVKNSNMQCGGGAGTNSIAIIGQDLASIGPNVQESLGNSIVMGGSQGPNQTMPSFKKSGMGSWPGVTHMAIHAGYVASSYSPIAFTGICGDYVIDNAGGAGYIVEDGAGDSGRGIVDLSYGTSNLGCQIAGLILAGVNIENQSSSTPFATIATVNSTTKPGSNGVSVNSGDWTGRVGGGAVTLAGVFANVHANLTVSSGTAFSDNTSFTAGDFKSWNLRKLSPSAGGAPGFSGFISGSTITGISWTGAAGQPWVVAAYPTNVYNGPFTICENQNNNDSCATNTGANQSNILMGTINLSAGGHIRWQDQGTCTMTSGACATVHLTGKYTTDPECTGGWTGSGRATGAIKWIESGGGSAWTLTPTSTVGTDTGTVRYYCPGW